MKRVFYIFALLLSLALGACQQSDYTYDDSPQGNLDALWTLIDQRYCFLTYKEEQLGFRRHMQNIAVSCIQRCRERSCSKCFVRCFPS